MCALLSVASSSFSVINFSFLFFSFCIHWFHFLCFVSCFVLSGSMCCLVTCFAFILVFLGYAPYFLVLFLFFRCRCLSSSGGFPAVFSGLWSLFLFLYDLLVIVFSVFSCFVFFLFCAFGCLQCDCPASSFVPLGLDQSSSGSAPLLRTPLCLPVLFLLLSSPGHLFSWFSIGCSGVRFCSWGCSCSCGVAPPFFRPFVSAPHFPHAAVPAAPSSLPLRFSACCGYGCSFQSSSAFLHAAAPAAPSSLNPRFPHAAAPAAPFAFGAAPAVFLAEGSPDVVPRGPVAALL